jgi:hypothetical protein
VRRLAFVAIVVALTGCKTIQPAPVNVVIDPTQGAKTLEIDAHGEAAVLEWPRPTGVRAQDAEGRPLPPMPVELSGYARAKGASGRYAVIAVPGPVAIVEVDADDRAAPFTFGARLAHVEKVPSGQWIALEGVKEDVRAFVPLGADPVTVVLTTEKEERAASGVAAPGKPWVVLLDQGRYRMTVEKAEGVNMVVPRRWK